MIRFVYTGDMGKEQSSDVMKGNMERAERARKVLSMFEAGIKSIDIARELGIAPSTVHCDLVRSGVNLRAERQKEKLKEEELILTLALTGKPVMEAVEETGLSRTRVSQITKKHNIKFVRANARDR